jgi:hypothetical protein
MLTFLGSEASERKLRLAACAFCRRIWPFLLDNRSRRALEVSEAFADSEATIAELQEAESSAEVALEEIWATSAEALERSGRTFPRERAIDGATAVRKAAWQPDLYEAWRTVQQVIISAGGSEECETSKEQPVSQIIREIFGNPFRPATADPAWLTATVVSLATAIYDDRAFDRLPILADALEDAGCTNEEILNHCRQPGEHVRGCWAVDLVLGKP